MNQELRCVVCDNEVVVSFTKGYPMGKYDCEYCHREYTLTWEKYGTPRPSTTKHPIVTPGGYVENWWLIPLGVIAVSLIGATIIKYLCNGIYLIPFK